MSFLWNRFLSSAVGTCRRYINVTAVRLDVNFDDSQTESVLWVPRREGFRIIGRGGETIKDLRMKTNSRITVELDTVEDGQIPVTIKGTAEACADARETIERIRAELQAELQTAKEQSGTTVWVPQAQGGLIIGKGGATIKKLTENTGAHIGLDRDQVKDGLVPVTIRGPPEIHADIKQQIEQLLANGSSTTVWVSQTQCGLIIGKGGATIKGLQQATGAYIRVDSSEVKDGFVPVTIKGEVKNCTEAKERIDELLSENLQ